MSNYPPGVTGNELEIAGPTHETVEQRTCNNCEGDGEVDISHYGNESWWDCPDCGHEHVEEDDGPCCYGWITSAHTDHEVDCPQHEQDKRR